MNQLSGSQMRLFVRTIMPALHRLQERSDKRSQPHGGVYVINDPQDETRLQTLMQGSSQVMAS